MKKALSLILAIIMVVAMIPAGAMAADATAESYTYNFKKGLHTQAGGTTAASHLFQCINWISTDSNEGEWTYLDQAHDGVTTYSGTNGNYYAYQPYVKAADIMPTYSPGVEIDKETQSFSAQTVKIEVKKTGTYTPSLTLITDSSSPKWEVFLTKAEDYGTYSQWVLSLDSSDRLGVIDGYGTGADVTELFLNRTLEAGSYYLTLVANGKNEKCEFSLYEDNNTGNKLYQYRLFWKNFSLKNVDAVDVLENVDYNITSSALKDPTTASNYDVSNTAWASAQLKGITASVLADDENKWTVKTSGYITDSTFDETGLDFWIATERAIEHANNGYFRGGEDSETGKQLPTTTHVSSAYSSSAVFEIQFDVAKAGTYELLLTNGGMDATYGAVVKTYFGLASVGLNDFLKDSEGKYATLGRHDSRVAHLGTADSPAENLGTVTVTVPGTYRFALVLDQASLATETGNTSMKAYYIAEANRYHQHVYLSGIKLFEVKTENPENPEQVAAQNKFNEIKATKTNEIAAAKNEGLSSTAYVNVLKTSIDGTLADVKGQIEATRGQDVTVTADTVDDYDFLYWRQGLGADAKVIASSTECTVKAAPGTWLTAVYKKADSTDVSVLFYNADGELIDSYLVAKNAAITFPDDFNAPAGCGEFLGWALNKKGNFVNEATASGKSMVFVAQYKTTTEKNIAVTVNGGATGGGSYVYGETVTVTATERENGSGENVFVYWKKGDEIVSFDKTYSFLAYETCTLTPVYAAYKPVTDALRKIIISGNGANLMAEFIGLENVKEKGILFDGNKSDDVTFANATHKIAMTSDSNFLSAINDVVGGATYTGYAILSDNTVVYDK